MNHRHAEHPFGGGRGPQREHVQTQCDTTLHVLWFAKHDTHPSAERSLSGELFYSCPPPPPEV